MGDCGAKAIAEMLTHNKTLESVSVHHNKIGQDGLCALLGAMLHNTTLRSFYISSNRSTTAVSHKTAEMLKVNTTLTKLGIDAVLCPKSAADLAEAIKSNTTLATLSAIFDKCTQRELSTLVLSGIAGNTSIVDLKLNDYSSGAQPKCKVPLLDLLKQNHTLTDLSVSRNMAGPDFDASNVTKALAPGMPASWALVNLTPRQRLAFLRGCADSATSAKFKRLPLEIIRRILTCYKVGQGTRRLAGVGTSIKTTNFEGEKKK
jgi:hypothetical protein